MGTHERSTSQLLKEWHDGDEAALEALIERHLPWLRAQVSKRLGPLHRRKGDTGDFVQEAMVRVFRHGPRFVVEDTARFRALLRRIVENHLADEYDWLTAARRDARRDAARNPDTVLAVGKRPGPASEISDEEEREWIRLGLALLNPGDREVIYLREWKALSFLDIGEQLGIDSEAARKRFQRALPRLSRKVQQLRSSS